MSQTTMHNAQSYGLRLVIAWVVVGIPLAWGVVETGISAMKLFQ